MKIDQITTYKMKIKCIGSSVSVWQHRRESEGKESELSLYQGRHHTNDRQGIESGKSDEYSTSTGIEASTGQASLGFNISLSHGGINERAEFVLCIGGCDNDA